MHICPNCYMIILGAVLAVWRGWRYDWSDALRWRWRITSFFGSPDPRAQSARLSFVRRPKGVKQNDSSSPLLLGRKGPLRSAAEQGSFHISISENACACVGSFPRFGQKGGFSGQEETSDQEGLTYLQQGSRQEDEGQLSQTKM